MKSKKVYERPQMEVIELQHKTQLLTASKPDYEPYPW